MTNLSTYSPNKMRRSNCLAYWRYTTTFYRVSIGNPLSMLETQGLDLQRMYKLLIRYASPRNIDTKLSRYSSLTFVSKLWQDIWQLQLMTPHLTISDIWNISLFRYSSIISTLEPLYSEFLRNYSTKNKVWKFIARNSFLSFSWIESFIEFWNIYTCYNTFRKCL